TPADVDNGSSDVCGTANLSINTSAFTCVNIGPNTVTLTVDDGNGNSSTCNSIVTVADTTSPTAICQNATVTLDASGNGSITTADINNGSSDNCGAVTLSLSQSAFTCADVGANTVTLTVTDGNSNSGTCSATVTVSATLPATAGIVSGSTAVCAGTIQIYSVLSITDVTSYSWTLPGDWTGTSTTNSISVLVGSSSGDVSVNGVNACGAGTASTLSVAVNEIPIVSFTDSPSGLTFTLTDASTNNPTAWSWDFGDGTGSSSQNPSHAFAVGGTYSVCLIATNECGTSVQVCQNVTVSGTGAFVWTGATNTDWAVPTNWNPNGVPNGDNVTIPNMTNDPYLGPGITGVVNNMTVSQDVIITIDAAASLEVKGNLNWINWGSFAGDGVVLFNGTTTQQLFGSISFENLRIENEISLYGSSMLNQELVVDGANLNSNGNLTVNSSTSGTGWIMPFLNGGSIIGDVTVERYVANNGFHYFGSAVNTPSIATQLLELSPSGPDEAQVIASANCSTDSVNINSPYGTLFEYNEGNPHPTACSQWGWTVRSAGTMTNARGFAARIASGNTITIRGNVNDGNISYNGLVNSNGFGNGFHLVSNPYPSPIQWNFVSGFDAAGYFWLTSGSYSGTYQAIFSGTGHQIASMQGFFVRAGTGPSNFAFTNADRISGDPAFYRTSTPIEDLIEVEVRGNGFADKSTIRFSDVATDNWDPNLDAHKMPGNTNQPMVYTRNAEDLLSVNSIQPVKEEKYVVLGFNCGEDGDGVFDFGFTVRSSNPPLVYLEDLRTGRSELITDGASYSFSAEQGQDDERFLLHFFPTGSSASNGELIIYQGDNILNISASDDLSGSILQVYDMLGQIIFSQQLSGNNIKIPNNHWQPGAYLIQVNGSNSGIKKIMVQ
ncbi:MAG: PKD repeat protein, partial [Flavobacteriales bacterium]